MTAFEAYQELSKYGEVEVPESLVSEFVKFLNETNWWKRDRWEINKHYSIERKANYMIFKNHWWPFGNIIR